MFAPEIVMKLFRLFLFLVLALPFVPRASADAPTLYRCSMHPWIQSDRANAKCTICGMALAPVTAGETAPAAGVVSLPTSTITTIGVETSVVSRQPLVRTLRVNGRIDDDDTRHRILSARVPGRVEQLHLNFVGAPVAAGEPLATIYSPEMLTAQRVYVERTKSGEAFSAADRAMARERLLELGLVEADLAALEKNLQPSALVVVRAPMAGTVVAKSVYEGQYVAASDRLFEIADFSRMWFVFDAYEQDVAWLRPGQKIELTTRAVPGEVIHTQVEFIDPNFNEMTRTTRVRATLPNPHYNVAGEPHQLPHRVLAEGRVLLESPAVLAAPRSAILDRGTGPIAYVDLGNQHYEARALTLGRRGDALVEVLSGLAENDKVVTTGALLIDAQAQFMAAAIAPTPTASTSVPAAVSLDDNLKALAAAAVEGAAALAADDYAAYQKVFPALAAASKAYPQLPALVVGTDLKSGRRSFEVWSTATADMLKPHRAALGLKVFQCPMAPVVGKGRWVQRAQPLRNPFFGSAMLECGDELP